MPGPNQGTVPRHHAGAADGVGFMAFIINLLVMLSLRRTVALVQAISGLISGLNFRRLHDALEAWEQAAITPAGAAGPACRQPACGSTARLAAYHHRRIADPEVPASQARGGSDR